MNIKAKLKVTSYQKKFLSTDYYIDKDGILRDRTKANKALIGGFGTGKTYSLCIKIIQRIQFRTKQKKRHIGICTAPVNSHFVDVLIPQLDTVLDRYRFKYKFNQVDKIYYINHGGFNHKIHLKSSEQAKAGRLVGINATDGYHDEFDVNKNETQKKLWESVEARLRDCIDPTQSIATTPEKVGYCEWLCNSSKDVNWNGDKVNNTESIVEYIRAETKDNAFLADASGYVERLRSLYTPKQVEAYLKGYFVNLIGNRVWEYFNEETHVKEISKSYGTIVSFWDFGWNDFTYCGFASISANNGQLSKVQILDEFRVNKMTTEMIHEKYKELCVKWGKPIADYCDPAGNQHHLGSKMGLSVIEQFKAMGLNMKFQSSNIIEGIVIGNNLLHKQLIEINTICKHFIKMMINSSYEELKNGTKSEKPVHGEYESAEAGFRYLMINEFRSFYRTMLRG